MCTSHQVVLQHQKCAVVLFQKEQVLIREEILPGRVGRHLSTTAKIHTWTIDVSTRQFFTAFVFDRAQPLRRSTARPSGPVTWRIRICRLWAKYLGSKSHSGIRLCLQSLELKEKPDDETHFVCVLILNSGTCIWTGPSPSPTLMPTRSSCPTSIRDFPKIPVRLQTTVMWGGTKQGRDRVPYQWFKKPVRFSPGGVNNLWIWGRPISHHQIPLTGHFNRCEYWSVLLGIRFRVSSTCCGGRIDWRKLVSVFRHSRSRNPTPIRVMRTCRLDVCHC